MIPNKNQQEDLSRIASLFNFSGGEAEIGFDEGGQGHPMEIEIENIALQPYTSIVLEGTYRSLELSIGSFMGTHGYHCQQ